MSEEKIPFDFEAVFQPDDYLYFYELTITDEVTDRQVAFLENELDLDRPQRILDLACGYGRHANRLAAKGHSVVGMDTSETFLNMARDEAAAKKLEITYLRGDMREIDFDNEFDRVLMLFTAVGYFDDETNIRVFQNVARALKPGGLFCFDAPNRDYIAKMLRHHHVTDRDGDIMIDRNSFDTFTGRLHNRRTVIRNGRKREFEFSIRLYNPTELSSILKKSGLEIVGFYGDWEGRPTAGDLRMITVARKTIP